MATGVCGDVVIEAARREDFLTLMRDAYGSAMSEAEFDWWFDANPAGPRILSAAIDDDRLPLGVLAMSAARMSHGLAAFAVHAVTASKARGSGVFSMLELHNERLAANLGASWALGFTNPMAGPILVGKLGWEDLARLRIWVRPKRLRPRGLGRLFETGVTPFSETIPLPAYHVVRDPTYLDWRYVQSPRRYLRIDDEDGIAVVTHTVWHGRSALAICEAPPSPRLLRQCASAGKADIAVALVNPGEERAYLGAGFMPTPRAIRFIGKRLTSNAAALPKRRREWYFTLGDLDFL